MTFIYEYTIVNKIRLHADSTGVADRSIKSVRTAEFLVTSVERCSLTSMHYVSEPIGWVMQRASRGACLQHVSQDRVARYIEVL